MFKVVHPRLILIPVLLWLAIFPLMSTQAQTSPDGLSIDEFFEESFDAYLSRFPEWMTELGLAAQYGLRNDRLNNLSDAYLQENYDVLESTLATLHEYDRESLTSEQQISYDVYEWWLQQEIAGRPFMYHDYPVTYFLTGYPENLFLLFTDIHPMTSKADAEDYITRLSLTDEQIQQVMEGLKIREEKGILPPDFILTATIGRLKNDLAMWGNAVQPERIALYTVFRDKLEGIAGLSDAEKEAFRTAALKEVEDSFIPAYTELLAYLESLEPLVNSDAGVWRLPDGDAYYQHMLEKNTSTDLTAQEIHALGLQEVERIQADLYALFEELGYPTDESLQNLIGRAASDGGFVGGQENTLNAYYEIIEDVEAHLDEVFDADMRPHGELIVVAEPAGGGGYYLPGSLDGTRPGSFHAGVDGRTARYSMPSLTYHEGIPGHHFQIVLAAEMNRDLPLFRYILHYTGYVEGWALYAERLAFEMEVYEDNPYGDVGRLEMELLRAVRLVTDTGIHDLGWTDTEAKEYMRTAMGGDTWVHEVYRYIVWPGQATGYMVGMLTILDLRQQAQETLGNDFNIKAFHRVILENGSLPLTILEQVVQAWIEEQTS